MTIFIRSNHEITTSEIKKIELYEITKDELIIHLLSFILVKLTMTTSTLENLLRLFTGAIRSFSFWFKNLTIFIE